MTKYTIIGGFLFLIALTGCQTEGQKAYTDILNKGTILIENDTVDSKVGDQLFYLYSFSAGVQPIYYDLEHKNSDSTILKYVDDQQFYVGDEEMSGGPSEGMHVFEGLKEGLVRLEFYNPYYNEIEHSAAYPEHISSDRAIMEFYKAITDSIALENWTDAQYANYYDNWSKLPIEAKNENLDTLVGKFKVIMATIDTAQKTKIIKSFVKRYALRESNIPKNTLDSLFNLPNMDGMERWQVELKKYKAGLPLHEELRTTVCYVRIKD